MSLSTMKRSSLPQRKKPLKRSTTPIRKVNPTAKAKRVAKQKAFYSSTAWKKLRKEALERAGHFCQFQEYNRPTCVTAASFLGAYEEMNNTIVIRLCQAREGLQVHHKTNARFGGKERPEDLQVLCKYHHELVEMRDHPTRHQR